MNERRHTVLVVDDTPSNLAMLLQVLGDEGYEVLAADSGLEALEIVEETTPDIFLVDVMMPQMDGYAFCRRLKTDWRFADIPVIFITAKTSTEDIVKGFEAGAVDYIPKPIKRPEVLARVRTHIRLHDALVELERLRQLALDANPLTQLPGNNTIARTVQHAIGQHAPVAVIYCDLDNFKIYNDRYGFSAGDRMLLFAADTCRAALSQVCEGEGFLGHIGGDDFVLVVPSDKAEQLGAEIVRRFDSGIAAYYNETDQRNGFIESSDRHGQVRRFPLVSISMAGVLLEQRACQQFHEVATVCAEVKRRAKAYPGSVLFIDRRYSNPPNGQ